MLLDEEMIEILALTFPEDAWKIGDPNLPLVDASLKLSPLTAKSVYQAPTSEISNPTSVVASNRWSKDGSRAVLLDNHLKGHLIFRVPAADPSSVDVRVIGNVQTAYYLPPYAKQRTAASLLAGLRFVWVSGAAGSKSLIKLPKNSSGNTQHSIGL